MGWGKTPVLAQVITEVEDLSQPLEVSEGEIGSAGRCEGPQGFSIVRPAHGHGRVGAIGQTEDQVRIDAAAETDHLTALPMERMMGMGDRYGC